MYIPANHKSTSDKEVYDYIRHNGFATLVSQLEGRSIATHIPMYLEYAEQEDIYYLMSHISIANEQKLCLDGNQELLSIFMNTHSYISSSWYNHVNVPTWNYIAIHVYGKGTIISGDELHDSIIKLVELYEKDREKRFHLSDMPDTMKEAHFNGIVGFKIKIDRIEAAYKLSQNRNDQDYSNIICQLEKESAPGSKTTATEMKKLRF